MTGGYPLWRHRLRRDIAIVESSFPRANTTRKQQPPAAKGGAGSTEVAGGSEARRVRVPLAVRRRVIAGRAWLCMATPLVAVVLVLAATFVFSLPISGTAFVLHQNALTGNRAARLAPPGSADLATPPPLPVPGARVTMSTHLATLAAAPDAGRDNPPSPVYLTPIAPHAAAPPWGKVNESTAIWGVVLKHSQAARLLRLTGALYLGAARDAVALGRLLARPARWLPAVGRQVSYSCVPHSTIFHPPSSILHPPSSSLHARLRSLARSWLLWLVQFIVGALLMALMLALFCWITITVVHADNARRLVRVPPGPKVRL